MLQMSVARKLAIELWEHKVKLPNFESMMHIFLKKKKKPLSSLWLSFPLFKVEKQFQLISQEEENDYNPKAR